MDGGKLSMTLAKVLNVPKRFANQDDDRVLDEDAIVVVGATTKVFDKSRVELADADDVRVQGKLLPPKKCQTRRGGPAGHDDPREAHHDPHL